MVENLLGLGLSQLHSRLHRRWSWLGQMPSCIWKTFFNKVQWENHHWKEKPLVEKCCDWKHSGRATRRSLRSSYTQRIHGWSPPMHQITFPFGIGNIARYLFRLRLLPFGTQSRTQNRLLSSLDLWILRWSMNSKLVALMRGAWLVPSWRSLPRVNQVHCLIWLWAFFELCWNW